MNIDDEPAVAAVVNELGRFLRADGADLLLVEANPKTARIHLRLVLDTVGCEIPRRSPRNSCVPL